MAASQILERWSCCARHHLGTPRLELGTLFEEHDFNAFPEMEGGKVPGLVTKFDFFRTFAFTSSQIVPHYDDLMSRRVEDVMTEAIVHVEPTSPLTRVLQLMVSLKMRSFPAMTPDRQLRIILRQDVMRALKETTIVRQQPIYAQPSR
jgi:CBS domain-containing protein